MSETNSILKPCPFCGGKAKFFCTVIKERTVHRGWLFRIVCTECKATLPKTDYEIEVKFNDDGEIKTVIDERPLAVEAWNRRAGDET